MTDATLDLEVSAATAKALGKMRNEDTIAVLGNTMWLLDGASRDPSEPRCCNRDTHWYVQSLSRALAPRVEDTARSLQAALADAIDQVTRDHRSYCTSARPGQGPSSTVVIARMLDDSIDLLALGDSTIIVGGPDPLVMSDRRLADVGRDVRTEIRRLIAAGALFANPDVLALKQELRAREAQVRNVPGGFWVAQDDPAAADHAITATHTRPTGDTSLALLSDGLERAVKLYRLYPTHHALLKALTADGIPTCISAVRAVEADDDQGTRYPRSSLSDDASAIVSTVHRPE